MRTTDYGFDFGPMKVERWISDPKYGYVLGITIGDRVIDIRCSPKGRNVRVEERRAQG
jgi:hypothetical protein